MEDPRGRRRIRLGLVAGAFGVALAAGQVNADLIYFRGGGAAQLPTAMERDRIVLLLPERRLELCPEDIAKRVPGYWPPDEWESRRREARGAGFAARYAAAWWAIENGLTIEAVPELRELHALDPGHGPTSRMVAALDRLQAPCPDPDIAAFREALGIETKVARGPHVLLFHQHSDAEAAERIDVLERAVAGFHLLFAAQGIELRAPGRRLVSAWFADRADYLAFLHRQGADAFATTAGYYHPTWRAVVAFDARSGEEQRAARGALGARREELRRASALVDEVPPRGRIRLRLGDDPARLVDRAGGRAWLDRREREAACRSALLDLDWRANDLGLAAHEMVHQLAHDSGLSPRHDTFPHWLHEGFAAQFEVVRGGRWAGISRGDDRRLPDWRRLRRPARLERLIRDLDFGRGYGRDLYAQAWALVYYLRARQPSGFATFLDLLRNPAPAGDDTESGSPGPRGERIIEAFRRALGEDLDALERDWHRFMAEVQTPIEQHAPRTSPATPGVSHR